MTNDCAEKYGRRLAVAFACFAVLFSITFVFGAPKVNAADPKATWVYVGGVKLDADKKYYKNGMSGTEGMTTEPEGGANATFDAANATLTLSGLDVLAAEVVFRTSTQQYGILANGDIEVILVGNSNSISFPTNYNYAVNGILVCADNGSDPTGALTISGAGNLTIGSNACTCRDSSEGISAKTSFIMNGTGSLNVTAANSNEGHSAALSATNYTQTSGTVTLNAGEVRHTVQL